MDIHRLIAEVRRKPGLWNLHCPQYKDRILIATLWNQVARSVNADVDKCKRKWRNLRDAYRAEIRRIERRMNRDSILGILFNRNIYKSKWAYFNEMDFMRSYKRCSSVAEDCDDSTNSNGDDYDRPDNDSEDTTQFHKSIDIKVEPQDDDMTDEFHNMGDSFEHQEFMLNDDNEMSNDMMFKGFESVDGSDSVEEQLSNENSKEANSFSENNSNVKHEFESTEQSENIQKLSGIINSIEKPKNPSLEENTNKISPLLATNKIDCKCLKRSERYVQFHEDDLCKKKQKLTATTKKEATDSCKLQHIGDSDYNFLISFLPQIKKMTALQNLQFRAKMSVIVLNTLAP